MANESSDKKVVRIFRGGAPDKIMLRCDGTYKLIKVDHTNLVDLDPDTIMRYLNECYLLPADEGDIKYANELEGSILGCLKGKVLLPIETNDMVIDYNVYVPKDSPAYAVFTNDPEFEYIKYEIFTLDQFKKLLKSPVFNFNNTAIKTTTGSGSRGVILVSDNPNYLKLGGKYVKYIGEANLPQFINFAEREGCDIMIQPIIPFVEEGLTKVNCDFAIRNGKLLGYKWDKTDPEAVFTNWNFGWTIHTEYTDYIMEKVVTKLNKLGIKDALMNFEAFSNHKNKTYLVEFNWRYSNSTFESHAAGIDMIGNYINNIPFSMPEGIHKFSRYWTCEYYDNIPNFENGLK